VHPVESEKQPDWLESRLGPTGFSCCVYGIPRIGDPSPSLVLLSRCLIPPHGSARGCDCDCATTRLTRCTAKVSLRTQSPS